VHIANHIERCHNKGNAYQRQGNGGHGDEHHPSPSARGARAGRNLSQPRRWRQWMAWLMRLFFDTGDGSGGGRAGDSVSTYNCGSSVEVRLFVRVLVPVNLDVLARWGDAWLWDPGAMSRIVLATRSWDEPTILNGA
jgi:hypothetical protein